MTISKSCAKVKDRLRWDEEITKHIGKLTITIEEEEKKKKKIHEENLLDTR